MSRRAPVCVGGAACQRAAMCMHVSLVHTLMMTRSWLHEDAALLSIFKLLLLPTFTWHAHTHQGQLYKVLTSKPAIAHSQPPHSQTTVPIPQLPSTNTSSLSPAANARPDGSSAAAPAAGSRSFLSFQPGTAQKQIHPRLLLLRTCPQHF